MNQQKITKENEEKAFQAILKYRYGVEDFCLENGINSAEDFWHYIERGGEDYNIGGSTYRGMSEELTYLAIIIQESK